MKSPSNAVEQKSGKGSSSVSNFTLSDSELTLSDSEEAKDGVEESACRESIRVLANNIEEKQSEIKTNKNLIQDIDKDIKDAQDTLKKLEGKIQEKNSEFSSILAQENISKSKLADLKAEIEELFIFSDSELYATKMHTMQKHLIEISGICGVYRKNVENLKEKIKEHEILTYEKLRELKISADQLSLIKNDQKTLKKSPRVMSLLEETVKTLPLDQNESLFIEALKDLKAHVSENIQKFVNSTEAKDFENKIKGSLKDLEKKNHKYEMKIQDLKQDFEEKRSVMIIDAKSRKDMIVKETKRSAEYVLANFYESNKAIKNSLREELNISRELEHKFPINTQDFDTAYKKYIVRFMQTLKNYRSKVYNNLKKARSAHFDLREKRRKKQNQLVKYKLSETVN